MFCKNSESLISPEFALDLAFVLSHRESDVGKKNITFRFGLRKQHKNKVRLDSQKYINLLFSVVSS